MREPAAEPLFTTLNQRLERLIGFSGRHALLTDVTLAAGAATTSVVGLAFQHRITPVVLAFCFGLCAPLLLRHRDARPCFALIAAVAFLQWLVSGDQLADVTVLIALYWVCLAADAPSIALAALAAEAGAVMVALGWEQHEQFKVWTGLTGLNVAAAALGLMIRQRRELLRSLEEKAARLERERDQQAEFGAVTERARIAREMHDIISHSLTVMIAQADGASYTLESEPAHPAPALAAIARVAATGRQALDEMRRLLGVLRDDAGPDARGLLEPPPTLERLGALLEQVRAAGMPVTAAFEGDFTDLTPGVQLAIFRVAQEALTNALKHASRPAGAHLRLSRDGHAVELDITSTLRVPAGEAELPRPGGRGLRGMAERAHAYGGELEAGPTGDGRWSVRLRLTVVAAQKLPPDRTDVLLLGAPDQGRR
jgi:signal transduction histidine kinase